MSHIIANRIAHQQKMLAMYGNANKLIVNQEESKSENVIEPQTNAESVTETSASDTGSASDAVNTDVSLDADK